MLSSSQRFSGTIIIPGRLKAEDQKLIRQAMSKRTGAVPQAPVYIGKELLPLRLRESEDVPEGFTVLYNNNRESDGAAVQGLLSAFREIGLQRTFQYFPEVLSECHEALVQSVRRFATSFLMTSALTDMPEAQLAECTLGEPD